MTRTIRRAAVTCACVAMLLPTGARAAVEAPNHVAFSTYFGGEYFDYGTSVAVDAAGNSYVAGATESAGLRTKNAAQPVWGGLSPNPQVLLPIPNRRTDAFVAKFDPAGQLVYSTYLGGTSTDGASAIAVDAAGDAYVTGATFSSDFPTKDPYQATVHAGDGDAFLTKLDPSGSIVWSTYFGGAPAEGSSLALDFPLTIAVDPSGRPVLGGYTESQRFPTTPDALEPAWRGGDIDGWVSVFSPSGDRLAYSTYLGGSDNDEVAALALDGAGNAVVGGATVSEDFPVTPDAYKTDFVGSDDPNAAGLGSDDFVVSLPLDGGPLNYGTFVGGIHGSWSGQWYSPPREIVSGLALGPDGRVYVVGYTQSLDFPTTSGAFQSKPQDKADLALLEGGDGYVFELSADGRTLVASTYLGAESTDDALAVGVDAGGRAYVLGFTDSRSWPVTADAMQPRRANEDRRDVYTQLVCDGPAGPVISMFTSCEDIGLVLVGDSQDATLTVLDPTLSAPVYSTYFGGWGEEDPASMAVSSSGVVTFVGTSTARDFPVRRAVQPVTAGMSDATLTRFSPVEPPPCGLEIGPMCIGQEERGPR
ncbi:MAG: SBBP repeat-containing protein [Actinomycetota bacterium]